MAEETTGPIAPQTAPTEGQPQRTSERTSEQSPQPETQPAKPVVNWHDDPAYKEQQRRAAQREREREQRHAQEMAQMRAQLEALATKDMTAEERWQHEVAKREAENQQLRSALQATQAEQARVAALAEISSESGAPLDVLMEADNPDDAWRKALRWAKENLTKAQAREVEEQERKANTVDIGRGTAGAGSHEAKLREIRKNGTVQDLWRLRREMKQSQE